MKIHVIKKIRTVGKFKLLLKNCTRAIFWFEFQPTIVTNFCLLDVL